MIENSNISDLKEKIKLCNSLDTNRSGYPDFSSGLQFCHSRHESSATSDQPISLLSYSIGCIPASSLSFSCVSELGLPAFLETAVSQAEVERKGGRENGDFWRQPYLYSPLYPSVTIYPSIRRKAVFFCDDGALW